MAVSRKLARGTGRAGRLRCASVWEMTVWMTLDVYFREDIRQGILAAMLIAIRTFVANEGSNAEHLRGMLDLAEAQAVLYSLSWPALLAELRASLNGGLRGLLDRALDADSPSVTAPAGALPEEV
jgi:hypothetical protein